MDFPAWTGFNFTKTLHKTPTSALDPKNQTLPTPFVVCITGANRGIGAATAKAFAQAGASGLVLTARSADTLDQTIKDCKTAAANHDLKITSVSTAIGEEESTKHLASVIKQEQGRLDLLINNAGFVSTNETAFKPLAEVDADQMQDTAQVNYIGRFLTIKYLLPLLLSSSDGAKAIVNISSISSLLGTAGSLGFSISALANNRMMENVAARYAKEGVVAYAVHPGMVLTSRPPGMPEAVFEHSKDEPGLCGAFLVWLTREKREWLSGRYLSVTWDVDELEGMKETIVKEDKLKMRLAV